MNVCELCGKEADIDFNCWLPSFEIMVTGDVCLDCMGQEDHDLKIAVALVKKRAEIRKIALPVDEAGLAKLAVRA